MSARPNMAAVTPKGYWSASGDLNPEAWQVIRDELPVAFAEGRQVVVREGITLTWHPFEFERVEARLAEAERLLGKVLAGLDPDAPDAARAFLAAQPISGGDDPISDSRQPEDGPPPGRWPR